MKYWFYNHHPKDTIEEKDLTEIQKEIIEQEKKEINVDNYDMKWLGYKNGDGWNFLRHGFQVEFVDEKSGNKARTLLLERIKEKYVD
jgi:TRAP-type C4-dicarboxylate transport system substrate-binding protein